VIGSHKGIEKFRDLLRRVSPFATIVVVCFDQNLSSIGRYPVFVSRPVVYRREVRGVLLAGVDRHRNCGKVVITDLPLALVAVNSQNVNHSILMPESLYHFWKRNHVCCFIAVEAALDSPRVIMNIFDFRVAHTSLTSRKKDVNFTVSTLY